MHRCGFTCADFSLNKYLSNDQLYQQQKTDFFNNSLAELVQYFAFHKRAAQQNNVIISQMHMPYPLFVPKASTELNQYLVQEVMPKSMGVCAFFNCPYIVVHGLKLMDYYGNEELEWAHTEQLLHTIAPMALENQITICLENLYTGFGTHIIEGPCCDAQKMADRIDRLNDQYGREVFGFCFDTGHANLIGLDMEAFLVTLGSRIKVLHIHDNDGIADLHQIPFTFTKSRTNQVSTDWNGFLRGLRAIQFRGAINFETAPTLSAFPAELHGDILLFLGKIGQYFCSQITQEDDIAWRN